MGNTIYYVDCCYNGDTLASNVFPKKVYIGSMIAESPEKNEREFVVMIDISALERYMSLEPLNLVKDFHIVNTTDFSNWSYLVQNGSTLEHERNVAPVPKEFLEKIANKLLKKHIIGIWKFVRYKDGAMITRFKKDED